MRGGSSIRVLDDIFESTRCYRPRLDTSRRANELKGGQQSTVGAATTIVHTFVSSQAHILMLESTSYLLKSATWTDDLTPLLSTTGYCWKAVEMSTQQVGVPSTKRKTFVACVRNHLGAEERLTRWRARLTDTRAQPVSRLGSKATPFPPH